ncbi:MAG: hypothetical protein KDA70_03465 [Planctomycetaceae bacterium]|nr:hypothetical protein [Planctomycetaceae bacterium]
MEIDIREVIRTQIYRDGGSLGISFRDVEGVHRTLMFKVASATPQKSSEGLLYKTYNAACLITYIESEYKSPVTGISYPKTDVSEITVSWEDASELLNQLEKFKDTCDSESIERFESMLSIASHEKHVYVL